MEGGIEGMRGKVFGMLKRRLSCERFQRGVWERVTWRSSIDRCGKSDKSKRCTVSVETALFSDLCIATIYWLIRHAKYPYVVDVLLILAFNRYVFAVRPLISTPHQSRLSGLWLRRTTRNPIDTRQNSAKPPRRSEPTSPSHRLLQLLHHHNVRRVDLQPQIVSTRHSILSATPPSSIQ